MHDKVVSECIKLGNLEATLMHPLVKGKVTEDDQDPEYTLERLEVNNGRFIREKEIWFWIRENDVDFWVCIDCLMAIAHDEWSGVMPEDRNKIEEGLEHISKGGYLVPLSDCGDGSATVDFEYTHCDCCGGLPGARHAVGFMAHENKDK